MNAPRKFDVIGSSLPEAPYPATLRAKGFTLSIDWELIEQSDTWVICPVNLRPWLLMIWTRSWVSAPAGSYTADDEAIAARIGMPLREFQVNRDYLMRGWYRADDGRLYHPFVTKLVLDMAGKREKDRKRVSDWRAQKNQQVSGDVTCDKQERAREYDTGTGTGTGTGNIAPNGALPTTPVGDGSAPAKAKRTRKPKADAAPSVSTLVWDAYSAAYRAKYRIDPVRNAAVNGQIANFVSRIPSEEAPDVATFYLGHKNSLYLNAGHAVNLLVRDAEKLRMEWATGRQIMPAEKLTFRQRDIADKTARVAEIGGARIAAKNAATYSADPFTLENEPHDAPRLD